MRRHLLLAISGVCICHFAVALALIPPWQQPDEHTHVAVAEMARGSRPGIDPSELGREAEILRSMADHNWWRHYGEAAPNPLPLRIPDVSHGSRSSIELEMWAADVPQLYYALIGGMLSLAPEMSVASDMYLARAFSALLGILTLLIAWRATRQLLGEAGSVTVAALLALHPQFAVVSTTASPDAFVNLAGAFLWWQAVRVVRRENVISSLALVWSAAILGAAADRMGVPLLVSAYAVSVFAILRIWLQRLTAVLTACAVMLLGLALWLADVFSGTFGSAAWQRLMPVERARTWEFVAEFSSFLFESWWFSLGWVRYAPPSWWVSVAQVLAVAAIVGLVRRLRHVDTAHMRAIIAVTLTMVAVQVAAVYWTYLRFAVGPQGRHLFPMLVPTLVLLWLGVEAWAPIQYRRHAALGIVAVFALLGITGWMLVGVPAYVG